MSCEPSFSDRVRFNWGFHDGQADAEAGRRPLWFGKKHHDAVYVEGYEAGASALKLWSVRSQTSEPAWLKRQADRKAMAVCRKALRDAVPDARVVRV